MHVRSSLGSLVWVNSRHRAKVIVVGVMGLQRVLLEDGIAVLIKCFSRLLQMADHMFILSDVTFSANILIVHLTYFVLITHQLFLELQWRTSHAMTLHLVLRDKIL